MIWRAIVGFPLYEVSDTGVVRNARTLRPVKPRLNIHGYPVVDLHTGKRYGLSDTVRQRTRTVHSLVCAAFHGPRPAGMEVAHDDGVKTNARASNLSWKTSAGNKADMKRHGTVNRGQRNGGNKLTAAQVLAIRASKDPEHAEAAKYGISRGTVGKIRRKEKWGWLKP